MASNGSVTVAGSGSTWQVLNRLFVGGNESGDGGTALLSITTGGSVMLFGRTVDYSVQVGPSGTVTGNGTLDTTGSTTPLTKVKGTLAPNWTLTIGGDLIFYTNALMNATLHQRI